MNFSDYIEKGQELLNTKNPHLINQAVDLFKKANDLVSDESFEKPIALYSIAYGNFALGKMQLAYTLVKKAYTLCKSTKGFGPFVMSTHPFEQQILDMINYIETKYPQVKVDNELLNGFYNSP